MRNVRQYDNRQSDVRIGRFGTPTGHRRPAHRRATPGPAWPAPASGYLEATGRDEQGHLVLTVVPIRAEDHLHQF